MAELHDGLERLRAQLAQADFPLALPDAETGHKTKVELVDQLDDYILPRLARLDAPLLAVLGGSTGAGKSTITNSLVGDDVSTPGVLRPTTRTPVLVCNPDDLEWFEDGGILPELPRSTGERPTGAGLHLVTSPQVPVGLAILDSPDIDSVEVANHDLAAQLLGAADLWLFVTTAARYADAVPWQYLARAAERSIALAMVVNRIPPGAEQEISNHLRSMMGDRGLADAELFAIAEGTLVDGQIGAPLAPLQKWLAGLVSDAATRDQMVRSSLEGALASVAGRADRVADAITTQAEASQRLLAFAQNQYEAALDQVDADVGSGALLRGEVMGQWKEIVGTGEFMDTLQRTVGRTRDKVMSALTGKKSVDDEVRGELEASLEVLVRESADRTALAVVKGWESMPGGSEALVDAPRFIDRSSPELRDRVRVAITEWERGVLDVVREMADDKIATARFLSFGINAIGVAVMVAVFASTTGLTGGELAVSGGTAAVSQTILTAVFGEQALRDVVAVVRDDLETRLAQIFTNELDRFTALLSDIPASSTADELRAGARAIESLAL